jgi:hypothetical protein
MTMRSPNELLEAAKEHMLDGRDPVTDKDWALAVNFIAANVHSEMEEFMPLLMTILQCPLDEQQIVEITAFQAERKVTA